MIVYIIVDLYPYEEKSQGDPEYNFNPFRQKTVHNPENSSVKQKTVYGPENSSVKQKIVHDPENSLVKHITVHNHGNSSANRKLVQILLKLFNLT